jgi:hypothetical protein
LNTVPQQSLSPASRRRARTAALVGALGVSALAAPTAAQADWTDIGEVFAGHYATNPGTQGVPLAVNPRGDIAAAIKPNAAGSSVTLSRRPVGGAFVQTDGAVEGLPPSGWRPGYGNDPTTAIAPDGTALASWMATFPDGDHAVIAGSTGPTGWAPARPLVSPAGTPGDPNQSDSSQYRLVALSGGSFLAVWWTYDGGGATHPLSTSVRSPDGTWGPVTTLTDGAARILDVLVDRDGNATVVWVNGDPQRNYARTEGFRSQRRLADGTWQSVRTFPGERIATDAQTEFTVDGYGNLVVVYTGSDDPSSWGTTPRTKLLKVATLKPGHDWTSTQNIAAAAGDPDATAPSAYRWGLYYPQLAATRYGSVLLTYSDRTTGVVYGILGDSEQHWGEPFRITDPDDHAESVQPVENPVQGGITMTWNAQKAEERAKPIARDLYPWDGTFSRRYDVPTWDDGPIAGPAQTTERGDTLIPYVGYQHLRVLVDDTSGPALTGLRTPAGLAAGAVGTLSVTATDAYSKVDHVTWDFGDGTSARGAQVSHAWKTAGTYPVSLTAVDEHGNPATTSTMVRVGATAAITRAKSPRSAHPVRVSNVRIRKGFLTFEASGPAAMNVAIQRRTVQRVRVRGKIRRVERFTPVGAVQVDPGVAGPVTARVAALRRSSGYRLIISRRGTTGARVHRVTLRR